LSIFRGIWILIEENKDGFDVQNNCDDWDEDAGDDEARSVEIDSAEFQVTLSKRLRN
jgi:hypothetical protein